MELSPQELAETFTSVGRRLADVPDRDQALNVLAQLAVEQVPAAQFAGVTAGRRGRMSTVAATDELVRTVDDIQYELGTGPCVDALLDDTTFLAADLRTDGRWPEFGRRAVEATGITSMLSFRLFFEDNDGLIAGLNMYSQEADAFDETSETTGVLMATHGALALANASSRRRNTNLEIALESNRDIGVAVGILMALHKVTREQAFDLLVIASQRTHRKLVELARDVVETGALPG